MIQTNGVSILNHYILVYKLNLMERFSIECGKTKTKLTTTANEQKEKYRLKRGKARERAGKRGKARESAGDQVVIDVGFASDWLREWREFWGPITEQS